MLRLLKAVHTRPETQRAASLLLSVVAVSVSKAAAVLECEQFPLLRT
jgi:hypothetical protein